MDIIKRAPGLDDTQTEPIGSRGLKNMGGIISEEYQKELRTLRQRVAVYSEMSNNPYLGAALNFFETLLAGIEYRIQPRKGNEKNERAVAEAEFVSSCFKDMDTPWEDFMSEVLTMLTFGFALMEPTFKIRKAGATSFQPDGRVGFQDIALRPAETLWEWVYDGDKLVAVKQQLTMTQVQNMTPTIPMERLYLFRTSAIKNNPEGRSILRRAYEPYVRSKGHRDLEAIGHEKDATGTPVIRVPKSVAEATSASGDLWLRKQNAQRIARQLKLGQEVGVILSSEVDPETKTPVYDVSLMQSPGTRQFESGPIIDRYNREMLFATGTDFILLGHEKTSSLNEGGSGEQKDATVKAGVNSIAERNCDVFNRRIIPDLCRMNGIPEDLWPEAVPQRLQREISLTDFTKAIIDLTGAGMPLLPDDAVENEARARLRLPLKEGASEI